MDSVILGMLAETFVHVGAGRNEGAIDLPFMKERSTDYPFIPGSGLKGALKDGLSASQHLDEIFGPRENAAGGVIFSDARLLLLPVRCLTSSYKWLTSPHLLARYKRDGIRAGQQGVSALEIPAVGSGKFLAAEQQTAETTLFLEERCLQRAGNYSDKLIPTLESLIAHEETKSRLKDTLLVCSDEDFTWFARYALPIHARNVLHPETKTSQNLWYEECLPPDALLYSVLLPRHGVAPLEHLQQDLLTTPYVQVGGNETVGQGWFALSPLTNIEQTNQEAA